MQEENENVSVNVATTALKIAYAAGFDVSDVTEETYSQHLFGEISNSDIEEALHKATSSPPLSIAKAATLFVSQPEKSKDQIKRITGTIGTVETVTAFSKLGNIWEIGDTEDDLSRKRQDTKITMLSVHNALHNIKHINEVAEFLSRHDF